MTRAMLLSIPPLAMLLFGVWLARRSGLSIDGGLALGLASITFPILLHEALERRSRRQARTNAADDTAKERGERSKPAGD